MNTVVQTKALGTSAQGGASWGKTAMQSVRAALVLCVVTGIAYPLATTMVAKWVFPLRAEGSLIQRDGQVIGSALLGQNFASARYFQGRPSVTTTPDPQNAEQTVSAPYNAGLSAGSNLGVTSKPLQTAATERAQAYRELNGLAVDAQVPVDAITASASGLDPHISVANAKLQAARVAKERGLLKTQVEELVAKNTASRDLWLLGEPRVNVLELNLALDALAASNKKE